MTVRRLNWGCGADVVPGWINSDRRNGNGIEVSGDICDGLPIETESLDYIVSVHALQEIPFPNVITVLQELRRMLKSGGVLRLVLPDLDKGITAYLRNDRDYFLVPDEDVETLSGKLVTHMLWYSHSRLMFTYEFIEELLLKAGFEKVNKCAFRETVSPYVEIIDLDNRQSESLFVEAVNQ